MQDVRIFVKIFVSATEFCRRNKTRKIKSDWICATCCGDKILLQRQRFSENFSSTHEAICRRDVSPQHVGATSCMWSFSLCMFMVAYGRFDYINIDIKFGSNCWIPRHSVPTLFSLVGVLWRTKHNTIDAILIQWHANKWQGILQLSLSLLI